MAVVNPADLFVKTKRRLSYTNRFKAKMLSFWLQPIDTDHRSGYRTLREVVEHTKTPIHTLTDWKRRVLVTHAVGEACKEFCTKKRELVVHEVTHEKHQHPRKIDVFQ
jgi:hypothetical protein